MFCPICRAEYRQGFTQCADCGVNLVPSLTGIRSRVADAADPSDDSAVILWAGIDPRFFEALISALDAAGIDHDDRSPKSLFLPASRSDMLQIRVRNSDIEAANRVLAGVAGRGELADEDTSLETQMRDRARPDPLRFHGPVIKSTADNEADAEGVKPEDDEEEVPEDFVENFDPDDATVAVWTGDDSQMAIILQDCLSNVGIGCVLNENMGKTQLLVTPAAEKRAREVVREIEEGTPMA